MPIQPIGLIAGNGKFPILFARAAKAQNMRVVAAAIRGDTSWLIKPFTDRLAWFKVGELKKLFQYFRDEGVKQVIMAGQVNPGNLFDETVELDQEFQVLLQALRDRKADTIFKAIADKLREHDLELLDSTLLLKDYMAPQGTLTKRGPTESELADMEFGRTIAKAMGGLDVGQTVVIKEKAIVAIEAMEGTDRCILRGGAIARQGAVVVKMSKPKQDERFDVPVIGPRTIKHMIRAKAGCIAIEAQKTLIIDRPVCIQMANRAGICVVAS
ncbi:MAG: UDP-2,3-diacylglucosamine diphosphatase LpxI [Candidatus Omnitrophota bacterium]|nr:UDP-2,3-diacylglucosamine diphosphatase LpxI [Candidatus Omnitrophota bacterium]MDZ4241535.1 UDP-2,3-diacylglucosamine diphosphatase LpxI [Candidatus Omnitrophota bacterium]